nr:MAG TPA: hypothetical protein [Caudoviricetes sp.]
MPGTFTNTLYPPQVDTFMPAFVGKYLDSSESPNAADPVVYISYSLSPYNHAEDIKRVHVSLVDQKTNSNALKNATGILVVENDSENTTNGLYYDSNAEMYYVPIYASDLMGKEGWKNNQYYKVQLRFDTVKTSEIEDEKENLWHAEYLNNSAKLQVYLNNNRTNFSEWSAVCLIKPILNPHIILNNFDTTSSENILAFNTGLLPISGLCYFGDTSQKLKEEETLQSYAIKITNPDGTQEYPLNNGALKYIYTGGNADPNSISAQIDTVNFKNTTGDSPYILQIYGITKNQYQFKSKEYKFTLSDVVNEDDVFNPNKNGHFTVELTDEDNGIVSIKLANNKNVNGSTIYIKRASSLDNYKTYETIYSKKFYETIDIEIFDNTVSPYVWYKYIVERKNSDTGYLTSYYKAKNITPGYDENDSIFPQFYDAIISRGNKQLRLQYNYKISSMKSVVNRSKIDTLGGKYPKFAENAQMNYKQFSISGLISAQADENRLFLEEANYFGEQYNSYTNFLDREYPIGAGDTTEYYPSNSTNQSLIARAGTDGLTLMDAVRNAEARQSYNYFWEREFREEVIKWLNDGEPKLYRSMTEGLMVVMITDISITPEASLSRRLWNFSATVYEIADGNSLDILDSLGIYNVEKVKQKYVTDGSDSGGDEPEPYLIERVSQIYKKEINSKLEHKGILSNYIADYLTKQEYTGIKSNNQPQSFRMKNIKIYFHSKPHKYVQTATGLLLVDSASAFSNLSNEDKKKIQMGYQIGIQVKREWIYIFVNSKGYYQIPDNINVQDISIENAGDVVTIDYILVYQEAPNQNATVSGSSIARTIVGQESGMFKLNKNLGDKIRNKYNFIKYEPGQSNVLQYTQKMQYWRGISLDVTPYALVDIKYRTGQSVDNGFSNYIVGETGVLYLLKDFDIQDIRFRGRKMMVKKRQDYLKPWECYLSKSVTDAMFDKTTKLYQHLATQESPNWLTTINQGDDPQINNLADEETPSTEDGEVYDQSSYRSLVDIEDPKHNTVYYVKNKTYIYYINEEWYEVALNADGPKRKNDKLEECPTSLSIVASVPIEGMINYYGSVVRSDY